MDKKGMVSGLRVWVRKTDGALVKVKKEGRNSIENYLEVERTAR